MYQKLISIAKSEHLHSFKEVVKSLGLVFGDIGTSPIYTLAVVFLLVVPTVDNVVGVLSLVVWTLALLVTAEYAWLAMSLGKKGEGGTIVLRELLIPLLKNNRQVAFVTFLSYIGISLLIGDGVLTPAVSILSALEGLLLIPFFKNTSSYLLIFFACVIAVLIFSVQKKGTEKVASAFGPLMLIWFITLSVSGIASIIQVPSILNALNPFYAVKFLSTHGLTGFFVLSEVILCATGGEALYADMGHLGRTPILRAWYFVFVALLCTYLGQGAFLIAHPSTKYVFYEMMMSQAGVLYIPFLILSLFASIIASQAMISGIFSIVYQGITTQMLPMFKIDYTSSKLRSQIYVGFVNWFLLGAVLIIILHFQESHHLAAAYGLAVSGSMALTGVMMTWIFYLRHCFFKAGISFVLTLINIVFLLSNTCKIPHGGFWSLMIGMVPFSLIMIYTFGQKRLYKALQPINLELFLEQYVPAYHAANKIKGSALFFVRDIKSIQQYILQTMFKNNIMYEDHIMISVVSRDDPFGVIGFFKGNLADGLRIFEIHMGYMEVLDIEKILLNAGIQPTVIFYGLEDISSRNVFWQIYAVIKRLAPSFVQFHKLPPHQLHGVVTMVKM
jgi:KUP system potassium uptake protein